jgi:hypothetical protein
MEAAAAAVKAVRVINSTGRQLSFHFLNKTHRAMEDYMAMATNQEIAQRDAARRAKARADIIRKNHELVTSFLSDAEMNELIEAVRSPEVSIHTVASIMDDLKSLESAIQNVASYDLIILARPLINVGLGKALFRIDRL